MVIDIMNLVSGDNAEMTWTQQYRYYYLFYGCQTRMLLFFIVIISTFPWSEAILLFQAGQQVKLYQQRTMKYQSSRRDCRSRDAIAINDNINFSTAPSPSRYMYLGGRCFIYRRRYAIIEHYILYFHSEKHDAIIFISIKPAATDISEIFITGGHRSKCLKII